MTTNTARKTSTSPSQSVHQRFGIYLWTGVVLAVALAVVILGWHARGGTTNPTDLPPGHQLSHTTVVLNSAILVFREGLETVLVLAASWPASSAPTSSTAGQSQPAAAGRSPPRSPRGLP